MALENQVLEAKSLRTVERESRLDTGCREIDQLEISFVFLVFKFFFFKIDFCLFGMVYEDDYVLDFWVSSDFGFEGLQDICNGRKVIKF